MTDAVAHVDVLVRFLIPKELKDKQEVPKKKK